MLKITLKKSAFGNTPTNRRTVTALGLKKTGRTVYKQDSPSIRGMIRGVQHLLNVEVVDAAPEKKSVVNSVATKAPVPKAVAPAAKKPVAKKAPAKVAPKPEKKEMATSAKAAKKPAKKKES